MTGVCDPSTEGNLLCRARKDDWATASLGCDETWTRNAPPLAAGLAGAGAVCVGLVAATRLRGSVAGAASPCGYNDIGVLALALAEDGAVRGAACADGVAPVFEAGAGFPAGGGAAAGAAASA